MKINTKYTNKTKSFICVFGFFVFRVVFHFVLVLFFPSFCVAFLCILFFVLLFILFQGCFLLRFSVAFLGGRGLSWVLCCFFLFCVGFHCFSVVFWLVFVLLFYFSCRLTFCFSVFLVLFGVLLFFFFGK